jgi:photosystem II stability/assembly factor-like uncharacterized protein
MTVSKIALTHRKTADTAMQSMERRAGFLDFGQISLLGVLIILLAGCALTLPLPTTDLHGVYFVDARNGWAVGDGGMILVTHDGGTNWEPQKSGTNKALFGVHFADARTGQAVGGSGTIITTPDGGTKWELQKSNTESDLNTVYFADARTGWAVGDGGTILATQDGGINWQPQKSNTTRNLNAVEFADARTGWAVGDGGTILVTHDAGANWQPQKSNTGRNLNTMGFVDARTGWAVGDGGTILVTHDGGTNWRPQKSNTARNLFAASFFDARTGWTVGDDGTILVTHDAGANWQPQKSNTLRRLWDVYFLDERTGWAVGNGGIILATHDGGIGWEEFVYDSPIFKRFTVWFYKQSLQVELLLVVALLLSLWVIFLFGLWVIAPRILVVLHEKLPDPKAARLPSPKTVDEPADIMGSTAGRSKALRLSGEAIRLIGVTALLFLATTRRALDAWIAYVAPETLDRFTRLKVVHSRRIALDLPIKLDEEQLDQPWAAVEVLVRRSPLTILIVGPGGAGKTTLACSIGRRALGENGTSLGQFLCLPLLIDGNVDPSETKEGFVPFLAGRLRVFVNLPRLSSNLTEALLRSGRVLVIVDGLSERDEITQRAFDPAQPNFPIMRLILTSRRILRKAAYPE